MKLATLEAADLALVTGGQNVLLPGPIVIDALFTQNTRPPMTRSGADIKPPALPGGLKFRIGK